MKRYILLCIAAMSVVSSCLEPYSARDSEQFLMSFVNNSELKTVWVIPEHGDKGCEMCGELPDVPEEGVNFLAEIVSPRTSLHINITEDGEATMYETYHPDDELKIYVFDYEVYSSNDWDKLKSEKLWLRKFSVRAEDVVKNNYEVVYQ